jgi:hypothetical protein
MMPNPDIKAISVTSSFAAVCDGTVPFSTLVGVTYTENDWAPISEEQGQKMKATGEYV